MRACWFLAGIRISATRGRFKIMSLLKMRAPGEQCASVETGLHRRATVPIAQLTSCLAVVLLVGGFKLMSVRMI